jgi:hypothetical protein
MKQGGERGAVRQFTAIRAPPRAMPALESPMWRALAARIQYPLSLCGFGLRFVLIALRLVRAKGFEGLGVRLRVCGA